MPDPPPRPPMPDPSLKGTGGYNTRMALIENWDKKHAKSQESTTSSSSSRQRSPEFKVPNEPASRSKDAKDQAKKRKEDAEKVKQSYDAILKQQTDRGLSNEHTSSGGF